LKEREKKMVKLLCVLGPCLLLALLYGYSQVRKVKARKAARRARVQEQQQADSKQTKSSKPAAGPGTAAVPSPPPGATPADNHADVPPAAPSAGICVSADVAEQNRRTKRPWGRDPFCPPDTQGPRVQAPDDVESPRGKKSLELSISISDKNTGNSGVRSAVLFYGMQEPFSQYVVKGECTTSSTGDGAWLFKVPAPKDKPLGCYVVAVDDGRLRNKTQSAVFQISPPPRERIQASGPTNVTLTLRGISWSGESGVALINNDVLAEGEYVHGYKVSKIVKNGVMLRRDGREIFLQLKE
jgi:hypothetical protein